tara:strand:- start:57 stop:812 length:756 start_codon:yes stop_codon:yes gene_type:complete
MKEENGFKYIEKGEGEILFLLHGLFGALSNFTDVIDYFSKSYKVIFPFLPLYEFPLRHSTVTGMVKYISELIEHKSLTNLNILGNSLGGHIAQVYALDNLDKVNSLILTGSSGLFENSLGDGYPNKENRDYIKKKTAFTFYDPKFATDELVDEVFETVNNRQKAIRVITMAKSAVRHNLRADLFKLTMPVKLIWGKNDTITPPFVAEEFEKLLPNAELTLINECGHAAMMEKSSEFNTVLEVFLSSLYKQQ